MVVITAEAIQTDAWLAKGVDSVYLTFRLVCPHRKCCTGKHGQCTTKAVTCNPKCTLISVSERSGVTPFGCLRHYLIQCGLDLLPRVEQRVSEASVYLAHFARPLK